MCVYKKMRESAFFLFSSCKMVFLFFSFLSVLFLGQSHAKEKNDIEIEKLVEIKNNHLNWPSLHYALKFESPDVAEFVYKLFPEEAQLATPPIPRLIKVSEGGYWDDVIEKKAPPLPGYSAFYLAVQANNTEVAKSLIEQGFASYDAVKEFAGSMVENYAYDREKKSFSGFVEDVYHEVFEINQNDVIEGKILKEGIYGKAADELIDNIYDLSFMHDAQFWSYSDHDHWFRLKAKDCHPLYWALLHKNFDLIEAIIEANPSSVHHVLQLSFYGISHDATESLNAFSLASKDPFLFKHLVYCLVKSKGVSITSSDELEPALIEAFMNYALFKGELEWLHRAYEAGDSDAVMLFLKYGVC